MKKIFYILITLTILVSCQDILDKAPLGIISDAVVWDDPILIDAYLADCYDEMKFIADVKFGSYNDPGRNWEDLPFQLTVTDEATTAWFGVAGVKSGNFKTDYSIGGEWWGYSLVRRLNIFLEKIDESNISSTIKTKRGAEARFLRAFAYFNMIKRYGGVPLITRVQSIEDSNEELFRERDTEADIYDFILKEIDEILNDLEDTQYDNGRPTKYAALALKSRAAMYAASIAQWGNFDLGGIVGIPTERATEYWTKSFNASKAIIDSELFELYNQNPDKVLNYRNIFLDEKNCETIFAEEYTGAKGKNHGWDFVFGVLGYHPWGAGGSCLPYLDLVESYEYIDGSPGFIDRQKIKDGYLWDAEEIFENKDPRLKASIFTPEDIWLGEKLQMYRGILKPDGTITEDNYEELPGNGISAALWGKSTGFMLKKYMDESIAIVTDHWTGQTDFIVFRYAEILLNYAEAAYALNKNSEALTAINQIRRRAGIVELASVNQDMIRHERKIELAFESHRYWDVRRWRTAVSELTGSFKGLRYILDYNTRKYKLEIFDKADGSNDPVFYERNYYYPIGMGRIDNNENLIENPGY